MFVRQNQQQFRNSNADVQIFYSSSAGANRTWNKPPGVSHVYMMCIGPGGSGDGASLGGGSGAVTVWYGAAQHVPDSLIVRPAPGSSNTPSYIAARFSDSTAAGTTLLSANGTSGTAGATAMTANQFSASGFFQSVAGVGGYAGGTNAATTTFLNGGPGGSLGNSTSNYGYTQTGDKPGYFLLQPIIVGVSSSQSYSLDNNGIGCGGTYAGVGGPGMVLIASW